MNTSVGEPGVLTALHDFIKWYMLLTLRFPKSHRVTLGDRIDGHLLDMVETAALARFARNRRPLLQKLNGQVEVLRHLTRVAVGLNLMSPNQYEFAARCTEDIGRQVGGWLKQTRQSEDAQEPVSARLGV